MILTWIQTLPALARGWVIADALLHHSDQGSRYASELFQQLMTDNGVVCSLCRAGVVWVFAALVCFFSSLKTERIGKKSTQAATRRAPTSSTISSGIIIPSAGAQPSAISARLSSSGRWD